jgi:two-component system CheB/CheR fusion protein
MDPTFNNPPNIALVDDDPWIRRAICDNLEAHGLRCHGFDSAEAFLKSPELETVECLILDVNFPAMDGLELQHVLNNSKHTFPIIFFTGEIDPDVEAHARKAGAADYFEKTVSPSVLIEAIGRAIGSRSANRHPSELS